MSEVERDVVVVSGVHPYGESDAVVRCFARERGRMGGFARGARASRKRFPGLQAPALATATFKVRRGNDGFGLVDLVDIDVDTRLMDLGSDLRAFGFCGYVAELIERFLPEGAPQPELFDVVEDTLTTLAKHGARAAVLRAFELQLLNCLGVLPDLSGVVDDPGAPCVAYDPVRGHLLAHGDAESLGFSDDARQAALFLLSGNAGAAVTLSIDDVVLREVSRLFAAWLRRQSVRLKSIEVLRAMA